MKTTDRKILMISKGIYWFCLKAGIFFNLKILCRDKDKGYFSRL